MRLDNAIRKGQQWVIYILLLFGSLGYSQVPANINSGDPAFPFPQFLPYENKDGSLGNLGTTNSPGVPHAELELRTREAYQIMCNNMSYTGDISGGVQYIMHTPTGGTPCQCAEADGYFLLAAAYMGDKETFDGLYMWVHDRGFHRVRRFIDGVWNSPTYPYSKGTDGAGNLGSSTATAGGSAGVNNNSATDGDVDVALALLVAYKQWGPNSGIFPGGWGGATEMNYYDEAMQFVKSLADTAIFTPSLPIVQYTSGDIGFDGYCKNGDSWNGELSGWAAGGYNGMIPWSQGTQDGYVDYFAPSYFHEFAEWLINENESQWCINQFVRAEASSDWITGQHYANDPRNILLGGDVHVTGATATVTDANAAEDVRHPWRHLLNYVWHGNPDSTWNPTSHEVDILTQNNYEYEMGLRMADWLNDNTQAPWNNSCDVATSSADTYFGPPVLWTNYPVTGQGGSFFFLNWIQGAASPAAIIAQDYDLMGQMFRQCEIEWDVGSSGGYLGSDPAYFHEWFRLLGMMILSGNHHAPMHMNPSANMKVYADIDKTFGYPGDLVTYKVNYRNYGSLDASNVQITNTIPAEYEFVSATGTPTVGGGTITWNIGTVDGFRTGGLDQTHDSVYVTYRVTGSTGRVCNTFDITCSNGTGWTSNEYPNNVTEVMERNCFDIVPRALLIDKTANRDVVNPGDSVVYSIDFENSSTAGWLNGGRPGVNVSYAHGGTASPGNEHWLKFRLWHDAHEAYINYGNYRISYYANDAAMNCYVGAGGCPTGWDIDNTIYEGGTLGSASLTVEPMVNGSDATGDWNQRIVLQFSDQLATTTPHLFNYYGLPQRVHRGGLEPLRGVWRLFTSNFSNVDWDDDWSWNPAVNDADGGNYFPISPLWQDPANLGVANNKWHNHMCATSATVVDNVLVEEWDGYTWRRAIGNGPAPGRDVDNVVVTDTLPTGLTWGGFLTPYPLGVTPSYNPATRVITWSISKLQVNEAGTLQYYAFADFPSGASCNTADEDIINTAWIEGDNESPTSADDTLTVTCTPQIVCPSALNMTKTADKATYSIGENITYTLDYTQEEGTIVTNPADALWSGSLTASGGSVSLNSGWADRKSVYLRSHGTNGTISGTLNLAQYQTSYYLVVRDDGTNAINIQILYDNADIKVSFYNDATQVGTTQSFPFGGGAIDFEVELINDVINVYLDGSTIPLTQSGMDIRAGYAGVRSTVGNSGTSLTNWGSHLDSGFDLQISDPVPAEVTFVSSPTGTNNAGTVEWPLVAGPVLAGTNYVVTWTGTVDACADITNIGYVNMLGQPNNSIGACVTTSCGSAPTCTDPLSASISPAGPIDLCSGDSQTLTATVGTATAPVGNWNYEFFLGGVSQQSGASNTFNATAAGSYTVEITDDADAATCSATSTAVTVNVTGPTTTAAAGTDQTICETGTATLSGNAAGGGETGTWTTAGDGTFSNANDEAATYTPGTNDITTGTVTLTWTIDDGVCTPTADNVTITIDPTPTTANAGTDQTICADNTTLAGNTPTNGTGQWTQTAGTGTITTDTDENTTVTGLGTGTNTFVWTITSGACGTSTDEVDITVTGGLTTADAGTDQNICTTSTTLAGNTVGGGETGTWTIVSGGAGASITTPTDEGTTVTSLPVGTTTLRWTIDNGVCTPSTDEVDIVVTGSATAANAGTDQSICETGTATLAANAAGGGETGTWTTSGDGTFSNANDEAATYTPGTNDITTGTVTLTWTIDNGVCTPTADNVTITIDPTPTTANAGTDQTICADNTTLAGNLPTNGTGQWTQTAGTGTITTDTDENTTVTTLSTGTNTFVWTITSGACGTSTDAVDITVTGGITTAAAGTDQTICETGTATLAANAAAGGETGTWTTAGDGTFSNANDEAATYTPGTNDITTGTVTLTWTIDNGVCTPTADNVTITIDPTPTTANAGTDQTICGDNTTLNGNTPTNGTGQWTQTAGTGTITTDTDENTTVTTLSTGTNTFVWTITSGACGTSTDAVDITAEAPPTTADAGSAQTVCADNTTLSATAATIGTGTWTVISGSGTFGNANDEGTTVTGLTAGANVFRWTTSNGSCPTSTDEVTITSEQVPTTAAAGTDQTLCADNTTLNGNSPTIGTGQWTLISGTATITTDTDENTTVTGIAVGTTVLRWTISNGSCPASTDEVTITRTGSAAADVQISPTNPATVCASIDQTFQAIPTNEGATPTYYWYVNGILQPEDQDTLTRTFTNGETVQVAMKSSLGCASPDSASSTLVNITTDDPPTTADAGTDQNICADNTGLTANTAVSGTGQWNILQGPVTVGTNTDPTTTISGIGAGSTVILEWAITNGTCPTSRDTVEITRSGTVTTAAAGTDQTICETGTATLAANAAGAGETGMWTTTGDGSFSNANDETATYTPGATDITNGTVTLQWEIDNGLCTPSTDQITITIDPTPTTAAAGPDQNICANNATLAANTPTSGTGQWTQTAGSGTITTATDENTTVTTLGTGTNTFVWTITSGACGTSTDEVDITVTGGITTADANIDQTICETSTATLAANAVATGETGTWTTAGDGSFSNANDEGATYTPGTTDITNGTVTLQWEIDNGVCTPSTDQITITIDQSPSAAVAGADQSICSGTATMSATAPAVGTGTWTTSGDGTFSSANDEAATYTPGTSDIATGTATLTWTVSNGVCADNTDNMVLTITSGAAADVTISSDVDTICFGMTTATFTATPANGGATPNYDWYANGTIAQSGPTNTFSSSTLLHGTYVRVELTSSLACVSPSTATDSMQIFSLNDPTPVLTTTGSIDICDNETTTLTGFGSGGSLQWYELSSGPIAGATSSSYTTSTSGQYYLEEDNGVCPASTSDTVTLNVNATPVVSAGPDQQIDLGTSTILNGSASTGTITWTPSITLDDATIQTPTASPISQTTYTITVVNGGCTASDQVTITVTEPIVVPNVFTPNADNDNDQWVISGLTSYPEAELEIFNRWGMPVYKSQGTVVPWDGTRDGEQMPVATYYYILKLNATAEPMTGSVTLVR